MSENFEMKSIEAAAEQGDMEAQFKLGNMYYDGEGTEVNYLTMSDIVVVL